MKPGRASKTAEAVAAIRAVSPIVYGGKNVIDDPYARFFLEPKHLLLYHFIRLFTFSKILRKQIASIYDFRFPGAVGWMLTRHKYIDDVIRGYLDNGVDQIVLFGAGYDTRPYRLDNLSKDLRIFEVDHPVTQKRKKQILKNKFNKLPDNVTYVDIDVNTGNLNKLVEKGLSKNSRSIFVFEGFFMYLSTQAVNTILEFVVKNSQSDSIVVFDYNLESVIEGTCHLEGAKGYKRYLEKQGENIFFGVSPDNLESYLHDRGLSLISDVGHHFLQKNYIRNISIPVKIYPFMRVATAKVNI